MKKNRFLKVASAMIILCLITTCAVSTTFAKYITQGSATDQARVAKWGVTITMDADPAFASEYTNTTSALTVKSDSTDKVVAPGTSSEDVAGGLIFAITGKPEVAVNIDINFTVVNDIFLKAGTYTDWTKATNEEGGVLSRETFDLAADYYPVVFTLKQIKDASGDIDVTIATGNLTAIYTALNNYSTGNDSEYAPNTDLAATFELTWAWAFDGAHNAEDTLLGNLMADAAKFGAGIDPANYNLTIGYELEIIVTQID